MYTVEPLYKGHAWGQVFDPCREFGCFQSIFFIVVDHCVPFTLAVVKSQVVLRSPFVERFHCILIYIII